ncbi:hypothetical protein CVS40_6866 [Lucilia cuprina]|nr:hypothetical protein CVS40_6866 [Lucilia cuprina]
MTLMGACKWTLIRYHIQIDLNFGNIADKKDEGKEKWLHLSVQKWTRADVDICTFVFLQKTHFVKHRKEISVESLLGTFGVFSL